MKVAFVEHEGCFAVDLEAETKEEAAQLVRFGMNRTDELRVCRTYVNAQGDFTSAIIFAKNKRSDSTIPRRK